MGVVHVLETSPDGRTRVIIHTATPTGNNQLGISWQAAGLASGALGRSVLAAGTGVAQITAAEAADIAAGKVAELETIIWADAGGTAPANRVATLTKAVTEAVRDWVAGFKDRLKFYGYTQ
jgi:hypothetical protein